MTSGVAISLIIGYRVLDMRWHRLALRKVGCCCPVFSVFSTKVERCCGNEDEKMSLKPHAVFTVTERQLLPSVSPPPHTHTTLLSNVWSEGKCTADETDDGDEWKKVECVNKRVEDRRGEAEMTLAFGTLMWCLRVFDYMRQRVRVFASIFCTSVWMCSSWEIIRPSHSHTMPTRN